LPDGQISGQPRDLSVQPHLQKYFCFSETQIKLYDSLSRPTEGRHAIVTAAGRDAVDARALGAQWQSQGEMNLVNDVRRARRTAL
jgi:hypothetical protein